ncbi:MAG TPA: hypothetical protein VMX33_00310 [bacterium]|nr:hypothetical protein [bacterium]
MDDDTLRRLIADIEDLKRAVKRNDPMLHEVAAPPGWIAFSLAAALCITLFAIPAHMLVAKYGSFGQIPSGYQIALFAILGLFLVLGGAFKVRLMMSRIIELEASGGLTRIAGSFFGGRMAHETIPLALGMLAGIGYSFYFGHPWLALSVTSFIVGVMSNRIALRGDLRAYYALGYWGTLAGLIALPFIEQAPFLWLFVIYGGMFYAFAAAQIVEKVVTARNARLHGRAAES